MKFFRIFGFSFLTCFLTAGPLAVFPQTNEQLNYLTVRLESESVEIRRDALGELRRFGSEAASRVAVRSLSDPVEIVRATAVGAVVFIPKSEASALVAQMLADPSKFVRREAADALGEIAFPDNATLLIKSLKNDKDSEVRARAAAALGPTGNTIALEPLAAVLKSKPKTSRAFLRRSAARAIGQIAEKLKNYPISNSTPESFLPDKFKSGYGEPATAETSQDVFRMTAAILGKVLSNRKEANDTRREAAFALGLLGDPSSVPLLRIYANDADYYLAEICREALIKLSDR